jgi:fatty acid amide hydrolase 2
MVDILQASATELAAAIRGGQLSSTQVVDRHIEQAQAFNPHLNAIVNERYDEARAQAEVADTKLATEGPDDLPLFHGVPCTIKECFAFEGMEHTSGLVRRKGIIATEDAPTVARIKASGAIPLGTTNVSELCMWMESSNKVYGRTNNPYDLGRIVGGSSGGEAAIIGSGASPFGLGSDVGGSIRMPAFFCGVFGHKASPGLVPNTGQHPIAEGEAMRFLSTGPLCRRADDLMPLLRLMAGPDGQDPVVEDFELGDPSTVDFSSLRVLDIPNNGHPLQGVSKDMRAAQVRVVDHLASLGARIERPKIKRLADSFNIWGSMMHLAAETPFAVHMGDGEAINPVTETFKFLVGASDHTIPAIFLALLEGTTDFPRGRAEKWRRIGLELRDEMQDLLGDDGILVYPPYPVTAPKHRQPLLRPARFVYTGILNVLHLAVTQVPLGLDKGGLPLGTQIAANPGLDHRCIGVALELERAFGGWVPPAPMAS